METQTTATLGIDGSYDRLLEVKAFDETKSGVKGLVDARITKIPRMFIHPMELRACTGPPTGQSPRTLPIVDLSGLKEEGGIMRQKIVEEISEAAASWGFFQVVNHGIPAGDMAEMIAGARRFFEQDNEVKKQYYTRDPSRKVIYYSSFSLYNSSLAGWSDSIAFSLVPDPPAPEELPETCREIMIDYSKKLRELGCSLFKVLAEGLALNPNCLLDLDCAKGLTCFSIYYPPCPEPDLTMGASEHSDKSFITVVLQDNLGGLQVLHQGN